MVIVALMFRSYLYHPTALTEDQVADLAQTFGWEKVDLETAPGVRLVGLVRPPSDPSRPWILFFGGNAMDIASSRWVLDEIDDGRGCGLVVFAYRGYDGSSGAPGEEGILHDSTAIRGWLSSEHGVSSSELVVVGQSLGSGVAAHLAASVSRGGESVRGLALISPYTSMPRVFDDHVPVLPVGWAVTDRYDTESLLDDLEGPVVMVHGTRDEIIGHHHAEELACRLGDRGDLRLLEGVGHNDLWEQPETSEAVRSLLD